MGGVIAALILVLIFFVTNRPPVPTTNVPRFSKQRHQPRRQEIGRKLTGMGVRDG